MTDMSVLLAAQEFKRFIDMQPQGQLIDPALHVDVRDTETYRLAAMAIRGAETKLSAERRDFSKRP